MIFDAHCGLPFAIGGKVSSKYMECFHVTSVPCVPVHHVAVYLLHLMLTLPPPPNRIITVDIATCINTLVPSLLKCLHQKEERRGMWLILTSSLSYILTCNSFVKVYRSRTIII